MDYVRVTNSDQGRILPIAKLNIEGINAPQASGSVVTPTPGPAPISAGVGSTSNSLPSGNISSGNGRQAFSPRTNKGIGDK